MPDLPQLTDASLSLQDRVAEVLDVCASFQAKAHHTDDHIEAVNAFIEKRDPLFTGR